MEQFRKNVKEQAKHCDSNCYIIFEPVPRTPHPHAVPHFFSLFLVSPATPAGGAVAETRRPVLLSSSVRPAGMSRAARRSRR